MRHQSSARNVTRSSYGVAGYVSSEGQQCGVEDEDEDDSHSSDCNSAAIYHSRSISISSAESGHDHPEDEDAALDFMCSDQDLCLIAAMDTSSSPFQHQQQQQVPTHSANHNATSLPFPRQLIQVTDAEDTIRVMLRQEKRSYHCLDYLQDPNGPPTTNADSDCFCVPRQATATYATTSNSGQGTTTSNNADPRRVDEFCREQICEWSFRVVDYFNISRDVVSIAMNCLDRFLSKCHVDRKTFKLAATTCLYFAMKVHEPCSSSTTTRNLDYLGVLTNLSRGEFLEHHLVQMETMILNALGWMVNPPIPSWFVHLFIELAPFANVSKEAIRSLLELASFYTELAVMDYYFAIRSSSLVGLAAMLEAMENMSFLDIPHGTRQAFEIVIQRLYGNVKDLVELDNIRLRLRRIYARCQEGASDEELPEHSSEAGSKRVAETGSPVSVCRT